MIASSQKQTHIISSLDVDNQPCSDPKLLESHIFLFLNPLWGLRLPQKLPCLLMYGQTTKKFIV
jgi:hypothetical protein